MALIYVGAEIYAWPPFQINRMVKNKLNNLLISDSYEKNNSNTSFHLDEDEFIRILHFYRPL